MKRFLFEVIIGFFVGVSAIFAQDAEPFNVPDSEPTASDEALIQEDSGQTQTAPSEQKKTAKDTPEAAAVAAAPVGEVKPAASDLLEGGTISDGTAIKIDGKGFSINPPAGWQIVQNQPGMSLLLKVPSRPDLKYQRNIQVMEFSGPKYIDAITGQEFSESIVKNYSQFVPGISEYKFRNFDNVAMNDGRNGLLFYTEFKLNDLSMMQALILLSAQNNHYLVIYSDVAENFGEKEGSSQKFLNESWTSMTSIALDTPTPGRPNNLPLIFGIIIGFLLLGVTFALARRIRSSRLYDSFEDNIDTNPPTDPHTKETLNENSNMSHYNNSSSKEGEQPVSSISKYDSIFLPSNLDGKKKPGDENS